MLGSKEEKCRLKSTGQALCRMCVTDCWREVYFSWVSPKVGWLKSVVRYSMVGWVVLVGRSRPRLRKEASCLEEADGLRFRQ